MYSDDLRLLLSLNTLLSDLAIPFTLRSPTELTPSLLLAILESLLQTRLSLPFSRSSNDDKIQAVKVFLGVLESDVLRVDVGLSAVDPRRLARGEAKECNYIARLLCWLGDQRKARTWREGKASSSSTPSSVVRRAADEAPRWTMPARTAHDSEYHGLCAHDYDAEPANAAFPLSHPSAAPLSTPRCIHEVGDDSELDHELAQDLTGFVSAQDLTGFASAQDLSASGECSCWLKPAEGDMTTASPFCRCGQDFSVTHVSDECVEGDMSFLNDDLNLSPAESIFSEAEQDHGTPERFGRPITKHTSPTQYALAARHEHEKLVAELARRKLRLPVSPQ